MAANCQRINFVVCASSFVKKKKRKKVFTCQFMGEKIVYLNFKMASYCQQMDIIVRYDFKDLFVRKINKLL